MSKEINKCPVCGSDAYVSGTDSYYVACDSQDCSLVGPNMCGEETAIGAWNRLSYKAPVKKTVKVYAVKHLATGGMVYDVNDLESIDASLWKTISVKEVEFEVD